MKIMMCGQIVKIDKEIEVLMCDLTVVWDGILDTYSYRERESVCVCVWLCSTQADSESNPTYWN